MHPPHLPPWIHHCYGLLDEHLFWLADDFSHQAQILFEAACRGMSCTVEFAGEMILKLGQKLAKNGEKMWKCRGAFLRDGEWFCHVMRRDLTLSTTASHHLNRFVKVAEMFVETGCVALRCESTLSMWQCWYVQLASTWSSHVARFCQWFVVGEFYDAERAVLRWCQHCDHKTIVSCPSMSSSYECAVNCQNLWQNFCFIFPLQQLKDVIKNCIRWQMIK